MDLKPENAKCLTYVLSPKTNRLSFLGQGDKHLVNASLAISTCAELPYTRGLIVKPSHCEASYSCRPVCISTLSTQAALLQLTCHRHFSPLIYYDWVIHPRSCYGLAHFSGTSICMPPCSPAESDTHIFHMPTLAPKVLWTHTMLSMDLVDNKAECTSCMALAVLHL